MFIHKIGWGLDCGGGGQGVFNKWTEGLNGEGRMIMVELVKRFVELNFLIKSLIGLKRNA